MSKLRSLKRMITDKLAAIGTQKATGLALTPAQRGNASYRTTPLPEEEGQRWFYVNEYRGEIEKGVCYPTPSWAKYQSDIARPFGFRPLYRVRVRLRER